MSDLLQDQKIHYIVKDYRRMYNEHNALIEELKGLKDKAEHKDNRIRDLEKQVEKRDKQILELERQVEVLNIQKPVSVKQVNPILNTVEGQVSATINKLEKRIASLQQMALSLQEIKKLINQ